MDNPPRVGDPVEGQPFFALYLSDHLPDINPTNFNLGDDVPSLDPNYYFITSGDAINKAHKLQDDLWALAGNLKSNYKGRSKKFDKYIKAVWSCAGFSRSLVNKLYKIKGEHCFLETEWRNKILIVLPKDPRARP
jgi:hypothetical protein